MSYIFWTVLFLPYIHGSNLCTLCQCGMQSYYGESMFITNCTNTGINPNNENIELLENLPPETEVSLSKVTRVLRPNYYIFFRSF